jgi:hypothetical protein
MTQRQMKQLAERLARDISLTQERNRRARISATDRRERSFLELGIDLNHTSSCQYDDLTL